MPVSSGGPASLAVGTEVKRVHVRVRARGGFRKLPAIASPLHNLCTATTTAAVASRFHGWCRVVLIFILAQVVLE